jgi:hypothetical protein
MRKLAQYCRNESTRLDSLGQFWTDENNGRETLQGAKIRSIERKTAFFSGKGR